MLFYLAPVLFSLFYLASLELLNYRVDFKFWILGFFTVVILGMIKLNKNWKNFLLSFIFCVLSFSLSFFVSRGIILHLYAVSVAVVFYFILLSDIRLKNYLLDKTAFNFKFLTGLLTLFIAFSLLMALYLNQKIFFWSVLLISYGVTFLISFLILDFILIVKKASGKKGDQIKPFFQSILLGHSFAILIWGVTLLPFGYLNAGAILLACYFVLINLIIREKKNSIRPFIFDLLIFSFCLSLIVLSNRWEFWQN